jgi:hypothetical protein
MWGFSRALAVALAGMVAAAQGAVPVLYSGYGYKVSVTPVVEGGLNKFEARLQLDTKVKCNGGPCGYIAVGFHQGNNTINMMPDSKMIACYTGSSTVKQLCPFTQYYARPPPCSTQTGSVVASYEFAGGVLDCNVTGSSVGGTDYTVGTVNVIIAVGRGDTPSAMEAHNRIGTGKTFTNSAPGSPSTPNPSHASGLSTAVVLGLVMSLLGLVR